jgi:hypothetical protein
VDLIIDSLIVFISYCYIWGITLCMQKCYTEKKKKKKKSARHTAEEGETMNNETNTSKISQILQ